jgi:hypothetical protein
MSFFSKFFARTPATPKPAPCKHNSGVYYKSWSHHGTCEILADYNPRHYATSMETIQAWIDEGFQRAMVHQRSKYCNCCNVRLSLTCEEAFILAEPYTPFTTPQEAADEAATLEMIRGIVAPTG